MKALAMARRSFRLSPRFFCSVSRTSTFCLHHGVLVLVTSRYKNLQCHPPQIVPSRQGSFPRHSTHGPARTTAPRPEDRTQSRSMKNHASHRRPNGSSPASKPTGSVPPFAHSIHETWRQKKIMTNVDVLSSQRFQCLAGDRLVFFHPGRWSDTGPWRSAMSWPTNSQLTTQPKPQSTT